MPLLYQTIRHIMKMNLLPMLRSFLVVQLCLCFSLFQFYFLFFLLILNSGDQKVIDANWSGCISEFDKLDHAIG